MSESNAASGKDVRETTTVLRKYRRDTKLYLTVYTKKENISSRLT